MLLPADSDPLHMFSVHLVQSGIDRRKTPLLYKAININHDIRCHGYLLNLCSLSVIMSAQMQEGCISQISRGKEYISRI